MISKLNFYINTPALKSNISECEKLNIENFFKKNNRNLTVSALNEGTLGKLFSISEAGKKKILKLSSSEKENKCNFFKEIKLFNYLYQDDLDIELFDSRLNDSPYNFFIANQLHYPSSEINPHLILTLTRQYSLKLNAFPYTDLIQEKYNFEYLLGEAIKSSSHLFDLGLINSFTYKKLKENFTLLEAMVGYFNPIICHGDLSPKNIMENDNGNAIVIDWEDAFWGFEGYDYLYWLTFFGNRKFYSKAILGHTIWTKKQEIAIMTLVILLKCELSFRMKNYHTNKLTFDERISEILHLDEL